jgi:hypothetical protein
MVVLLIGMAVTAVWMSVMLPAWRQQAVREREADLIFRGEQYARAIALYWRKNNQTLPPNIDILVSQRYLRQKYKDPITNSDFLPIGGLGMPAPGLGQPPPSPGVGLGAGPSPSRGVGGRGQTPPGSPQPASGRMAGVSGVRSTSTAASIVVYRGQQSYSQFPFDYAFALQRMGASPAAGGQPGGRRGVGGPPVIVEEVAPVSPGRGRGPARGGGLGAPAPGRRGG